MEDCSFFLDTKYGSISFQLKDGCFSLYFKDGFRLQEYWNDNPAKPCESQTTFLDIKNTFISLIESNSSEVEALPEKSVSTDISENLCDNYCKDEISLPFNNAQSPTDIKDTFVTQKKAMNSPLLTTDLPKKALTVDTCQTKFWDRNPHQPFEPPSLQDIKNYFSLSRTKHNIFEKTENSCSEDNSRNLPEKYWNETPSKLFTESFSYPDVKDCFSLKGEHDASKINKREHLKKILFNHPIGTDINRHGKYWDHALYTSQFHNCNINMNAKNPLTKVDIVKKTYGYPIKKTLRRCNFPKNTTKFLRDWLLHNSHHPYPSEEEKVRLAKVTKLTLRQVNDWMINARRRYLKHKNTNIGFQ